MPVHIDYYISLNSPWCHLGAARIERMALAADAMLRILPVDFGAIFSESGGLPLPRRAPQRQTYRLSELKRWRDHLGIPIVIQPKHFPANEVLSASCVIAVRESLGNPPAIKLAHAILKAVWEREMDPAEPTVLALLIKESGLDPNEIMASGTKQRWADQRVNDTKAALERGVFGAPSYVIDGEIFWGQDRLEFVERKLARD